MDNSTFIQAYLLTLVACIVITIGLIIILNKGLEKFFKNISQDNDIAKFFIKMTNLIIFLGGLSAALKADYSITKESNWLTLTWNIAEQLEASLLQLFQ